MTIASHAQDDKFIALLELNSDGFSDEQCADLEREIIDFLNQYPDFFNHTKNHPKDLPMFQVSVLLEYQIVNPSVFIPYEFLIDALYDEEGKFALPKIHHKVQVVLNTTKNGELLSKEEKERLQNVVWEGFSDYPQNNQPLLPMLYDLLKNSFNTKESSYKFFDLLRNSSPEGKHLFASFCHEKDPSSPLAYNTRLVALLSDLKTMLCNRPKDTSSLTYHKTLLSIFETYHKTNQEHTSVFLRQNMSDWLEYLFEMKPSSAQSFTDGIDLLPSKQGLFFKKNMAQTWVNTPSIFLRNGPYETIEHAYDYFKPMLNPEDKGSLLAGFMAQSIIAHHEKSREKFTSIIKHMTQYAPQEQLSFIPTFFWKYQISVLHPVATSFLSNTLPRLRDSLTNCDPRFMTLLLTTQEVCGEQNNPSILKDDCQGFDVPPPPPEMILYLREAPQKFDHAQAIVRSLWEKQLLQKAIPRQAPHTVKKM